MTSQHYHRVLDVAVSRRATLKAAAALGAGGFLLGPALRPAAAQDATYPETVIIATDYAYDMPASIESGWNRLTLDNQGMMDHHAIFFRLNDGVTPDQFNEVLASGDLAALADVGASYGGPVGLPGTPSSVVAFLDPGTYVVFCVIPNEEGIPHFVLGMISLLEVTQGADAAADPVADGTISMIEMAFDGLPAEVPAGSYVWEIVNNGTQLHEIVVMQLAPGLTAEAALEMFLGPAPGATPVAATPVAPPAATPVAEGPPFVAAFGAAPMSPGATNYAELDLTAGEYLAVCFVPDAETGVPHALMGMVGSFTVA